VLVDVVAMLEVPVPVVDMVDVVTVLNGLAPVILGVRGTVLGMDLGFGVPFAVVDMVHVVAVHDRLMTVAGKVLVVARFDVFGGCHCSSPSFRTSAIAETRRPRSRPDRNDNGNRCQ